MEHSINSGRIHTRLQLDVGNPHLGIYLIVQFNTVLMHQFLCLMFFLLECMEQNASRSSF